ncbi:MAG TPA: flagellar basal body rod protein FlgB [Planctomycetaceae bacterium]|nr:flagellar basal body rod protein FlgB [Planctomycetaceae bacterium]
MWQSWLNGSSLPALEQSAAFAQKRHLVLAGNIANIDTPDYKTRDLSVDAFHSALREAVDNPQATPQRYSDEIVPNPMEQVRDVGNQVLFHDGSDVSLEEQVTELSKNQSTHNMAISLMRSQFRTLQVAIQESVAV